MQIQKMSTLVSRSIIVFATLALGSLASAQTDYDRGQSKDARTCSNRTLRGNYGFTIQGTLTVPGETLQNGAGLPLRGVVMQHYDGEGNLTQVDHVVVNGTPPPLEWTPGSGTYSVNPDCTGTAVINSPSSPTGPVSLHFVVVKEGREIHQVVDINAVTAIGIKVE